MTLILVVLSTAEWVIGLFYKSVSINDWIFQAKFDWELIESVINAGESILALWKLTIRAEFRQVEVDRCLFDKVKENVLMDYRSYV